MSCPCSSTTSYADCCQPYHLGRVVVPTPESLMRSRYSAYAKGLVDYLMKTTHPENAQFDSNSRRWRLGLAQYCQHATFESLTILDAPPAAMTDTEGCVTFEAVFSLRLAQGIERQVMREKSHFLKVDGRWLYYAGEAEISAAL